MAPPKGDESSSHHHHNAYDDVELASVDGTGSSSPTPKPSFDSLSPRRPSKLLLQQQQQQHQESLLLIPPIHQQHKNLSSFSPSRSNNHATSSVNSSSNSHLHHHHHHHAANSIQGKAISACLLYSFCSVSMVLTNKSLASSYNDKTPIDLNILLVVFQAVFAVLCVEFSKRMKWVDYPELTVETIKLWVPVNLFFCAMLFTGMASLQHNSVPMVTIFKNITNIMVAAGDFTFFGATVEMLVVASFAVTLGGAIAAAWNDISSSWIGLFWMSANCVSCAGYVLYMKYATKHIKLSKFGMVFVNNLLCAVFLFPVSIMKGEVSVFINTSALHTLDYYFKNCVAGFMGFFLNFAALNCVSTTGPTTYAVVGSLNKIPVALLGYVMFDSKITQQTWFFICVSLCGGFLYSYAKIRQAAQKAVQGSK